MVKCMTKGCSRAAEKLDVCGSCYSVVYRAVKAKTMTWARARREGLVGKRKRRVSPMQRRLADSGKGKS